MDWISQGATTDARRVRLSIITIDTKTHRRRHRHRRAAMVYIEIHRRGKKSSSCRGRADNA